MTRLFRPKVCAVIMAMLLWLTPVASWAATTNVVYSGGTLTVTTPDSYSSCDPANMITITGVTAGHPVAINFFRYDATLNMMFLLGTVTTEVDGSWAFPYPEVTGTMTFVVSIYDLTLVKNVKGMKWSITCTPTGGQGCTPGYWRNHYGTWPAPYEPATSFNGAFILGENEFGEGFFSDSYTLGQAIWQGGGGVNRLARHGAAALLSTASDSVDYPYTVEEVIGMVQSGTVDPLAQANELGCPLR